MFSYYVTFTYRKDDTTLPSALRDYVAKSEGVDPKLLMTSMSGWAITGAIAHDLDTPAGLLAYIREMEKDRVDFMLTAWRKLTIPDAAPPKHPNAYWLIWFEDADVKPIVFTDEASARNCYAEKSQSWNCHLFQGIESNHKDSA